MDPLTPDRFACLFERLKNENKQDAMALLSDQDDGVLWSLYQHGNEDALTILFKKYHRQIVVLVYHRSQQHGNISLAAVKDAFGDFIEKILSGDYQNEALKKNFIAFAIHHLLFIVRSKARLVANSRVGSLQEMDVVSSSSSHLRVEQKMDIGKVIDLIPMVTNKVYRKVLWLVFIMGYNSSDLIQVFGQREKAYDKRSRAMKTFRDLLDKEGILEELR